MIQALILFLSVIAICAISSCICSSNNTQVSFYICDRKLTECFRGVAILLIMIQHLAGIGQMSLLLLGELVSPCFCCFPDSD